MHFSDVAIGETWNKTTPKKSKPQRFLTRLKSFSNETTKCFEVLPKEDQHMEILTQAKH